jgi:hypothetical protein
MFIDSLIKLKLYYRSKNNMMEPPSGLKFNFSRFHDLYSLTRSCLGNNSNNSALTETVYWIIRYTMCI